MNKRDIHRIVCLMAIIVDLALFNYAYNHSDTQKDESIQVESVHITLHNPCDNFSNKGQQFPKDVNIEFLNKNMKVSNLDFTLKYLKVEEENAILSMLRPNLEFKTIDN